MSDKIKIKCRNCGHEVTVDHSWAEKIEKGATYPSSASINAFLMRKKDKLKCSLCGGKNPDILYNIPFYKSKKVEIPEHEKRYIDEGLAGTRRGHKRMRGQQWSEMVKRHKE